jgi:hypothetical protein
MKQRRKKRAAPVARTAPVSTPPAARPAQPLKAPPRRTEPERKSVLQICMDAAATNQRNRYNQSITMWEDGVGKKPDLFSVNVAAEQLAVCGKLMSPTEKKAMEALSAQEAAAIKANQDCSGQRTCMPAGGIPNAIANRVLPPSLRTGSKGK